MRRPIVLLALVVIALLGAMAAKSLLIRIPPVRAQAASGQFDANRAKSRLAHILGDRRPHPADTPANDRVRERIIGLLVGMGLKPNVRDRIACNELYKSRGVSCARVRNVIAVIGPPTGKALLLNAHYDSTPVGPGAGDAGIGVATLLEVASILKDRPLQRPVIFLFNEGEELGLVGARAFLADPLSRNVDSLINLEARGLEGPVNMFETSRPDGPAIRVFANAVDRPVANSLSTDVYRLMPNYTDVNTFSERGWLTLNLAPIGNETRYHSPGDTVHALNPATLQHMGDQTLSMTRELANGVRGADAERIFMDVAGRILITLPLVVGAVLLIGLLAAFALLSALRGRFLRSLVVTVATVVMSTGLSWVALALIGLVRQGQFWRGHPEWTHLASYASVILAAILVLATAGRRAEVRQLRTSFWLVYLATGGLIGLFAPGGIVYFLFPPLLVLAGMLASRWWKPAEIVGSLTAIAFLYLSWGEMLALLEELLNSGPMWLFAPLGALVILPIFIEAKPLIDGARTRSAIAIASALALLGWTVAAVAPAYSADRQQRFVIEHVTDANAGKSYWSILNGRARLPEAYKGAGKWRWAKLEHSEAKRWLADASTANVAAPAAERIVMLRTGSERTIRLRLHPKGAERLILIAPEDARIRAAGTPGFVRPIDVAGEDGKYLISCFGRSCDGMTLDIVTGQARPIEFIVAGVRRGLPQSAAPLIAARPKFARPQYAPDQTIVFTRTRL